MCESREARFDLVRPNRKVGQNVSAGFIGDGGAHAPVSVCVTVTSTPGNTAPLASAIEPLIWAVD